MKTYSAVLAGVMALSIVGVLNTGCSSEAAPSVSETVAENQTAELRRLFTEQAISAPFSPSMLTGHKEAMVHVQTQSLNIYITFQNAAGIPWPQAEGVTYIFHPSADWLQFAGRDTTGAPIQVAPEDAASFVVHGENRSDICNGASLDVTGVSVSDSLGHTYTGVTARLTVLARSDRAAPTGVHTNNTSPSQGGGSGGGGDDGAGGDQAPKQCQGQSAGGGGTSTESLHILGASGVLNGGCPLVFWSGQGQGGGGGCSASCQTKVNIGAFGIEACLYAGTPGTCTEHRYWTNGVAGRGGVGVPNQGHYEYNCTCD